MNENVTYGIGGMLDDHPNGNVVERVVDNGDGTGTRTTYDAAGEVESTENLTGLPVVDPTPTPDERIADLEAQLSATAGVLAELLDLLGGQ